MAADLTHPVRSLWDAMSRQRRELGVAGVMGAIASGSAVALLGVSAWLIATAAQMPPVLTLTVAAVLVRTMALSRALFRYVERLVGHDAAFRGLTQLRVSVYQRLEQLAPTGLRAFGRGDLLARLVADVDAALDLPLRVVLPWVQAVLVAGATVAFLAWLLPSVGLVIAVLSIVAVALVPWLVSLTSRVAEARMAPARAELTAMVVRAFDATPEIAAFGTAPSVAAQVSSLDDRVTRLNGRESFSLGLGGGIGTVVQGCAVTAALVLAVPAVLDGRIEPVWLAVAALLPLALFDVLGTLPSSALAYQRIRGSALRLAEVADLPLPVTDPRHPLALPHAFTGVEIRGMRARWVPDTLALDDIDLSVAPGSRIAVVGPSGAGKSTLAAVLMGFLPYEGSVAVSGVEIREADGDDLRRHVGLLTQQAHIFDTTIADNIRIGDPDASDESIELAVADAQLSSWIARLPRGIDAPVGGFGLSVSGGERQRIALARLLVARRSFVILDEPTEHLDGATADALSRTMNAALSDATVLLITHRLLGVEDFDLIVQLGKGRVVARGTHDELMRRGGWYAEQWTVEAERQDMSRLLPELPIGRAVPAP
ncbi:MAG TPA: thiol reductant ABC exporter subunit CydC [Actinobacteria bacterium]|nr:thiol reductant ABC exporter subunit CydC [Actinomycetota bacterium]